MRIFDGLRDAAAQVVSPLGETLLQTPLSVALIGDESAHQGLARSLHYRWFTDPATRLLRPAEGRLIVADLHGSCPGALIGSAGCRGNRPGCGGSPRLSPRRTSATIRALALVGARRAVLVLCGVALAVIRLFGSGVSSAVGTLAWPVVYAILLNTDTARSWFRAGVLETLR